MAKLTRILEELFVCINIISTFAGDFKKLMIMANNKRFIWEKVQNGIMKDASILIDKETGVNYLFVEHGYAGGLTPLLDKNGKPVITPPNEIIDKM